MLTAAGTTIANQTAAPSDCIRTSECHTIVHLIRSSTIGMRRLGETPIAAAKAPFLFTLRTASLDRPPQETSYCMLQHEYFALWHFMTYKTKQVAIHFPRYSGETMIRPFLFLLTVTIKLCCPIWCQFAPDASGTGPLAVTSSEYKLPAGFDNIVLADAPASARLMTELWATVYRPVSLSAAPFQMLVFLHRNHATCGRIAGAGQGHFDISVEYTFDGMCPDGYIVVRSDQGYAYLAQRLASWGYIVVSINANRGVNAAPGYAAPAGSDISVADGGLNLRRGRLVLRHLEQLFRWNAGTDTTPASLGFNLTGKLDFSNVGLFGHSRGGEGVRAAYNYYLNAALPARGQNWQAVIPGLVVRGVFEVGPVDGQTGLILNAPRTVWNVLLPMCDGDVFNLQGVKPFDRMLLDVAEVPAVQKSTFAVWGTNHNFYNTEWQTSDSAGCFANRRLFDHLYGSADQRSIALSAVLALFRGNVGPTANPLFNQNFNPQIDLPVTVTNITRVDRGTAIPVTCSTISPRHLPTPMKRAM